MRAETYEPSEREVIALQVAADDAFQAAMNRAIKRRKVKVKRGTYVDRSPPKATAFRIRGVTVMGSGCGSPAAMCAESAGMES